MPHFNVGQHHLLRKKRPSLRARIVYAMHQTSFKKRLDKVMYPIGLLGPLLMLPQILKIYMEQDASSIALSSWALFTIPVTVWIVYGLAHKEKVVVLCNVVWLIMYLLVIVGALLY